MKAFPWHEAEFAAIARRKDALPHALLLQGPRGIGKLAFAQSLAQALLCEAPAANGLACGHCAACTWFEVGSHPDYRLVERGNKKDEEGEAAEKKPQIEVDQIRALADFVNMSSHRGGRKVVLVHPAEALNANAANALLKSLEEPPPATHFLLVTHRPQQLLPTITSRCQRIGLRVPNAATAGAWLAGEGVRQTELALAHTGQAPLAALELEGTQYWGARAAFLRHITTPNLDVLSAAEAAQGCRIADVIAWLQKWSYDISHYRVLGRVRYNPDHAEAIARAAAGADGLEVLRFHREMVKLQAVAQHPLNARLFIEQVLIAYRDCLQPQAAVA